MFVLFHRLTVILPFTLLFLEPVWQEENLDWVNWIATSKEDGNQTEIIRAQVVNGSLVIETTITDRERPKESLQERRILKCNQIDEVSSLKLESEQGFSNYLKLVWHEDGGEPDQFEDPQGRAVPRAILLGPYSQDTARNLKKALFKWRCP